METPQLDRHGYPLPDEIHTANGWTIALHLRKLPPGWCSAMFGYVVLRVGDRYVVGSERISLAGEPLTEAEAVTRIEDKT